MNEELIISMTKPYIKEGTISYGDFDIICAELSASEQDDVIDVFLKKGIVLSDGEENETAAHNCSENDISNGFAETNNVPLPEDSSISVNVNKDIEINCTVEEPNEMLCRLVQEGSRQAMQDLCVKNKRLVDKYAYMCAKKYGIRNDFEDLEQAGYIGLLKAAQKFDISLGYSFTTYAVWWIRQSIAREIMDTGYAIRIPVHMMEKIFKVSAMNNSKAAYGITFDERIFEIADELNITEESVRECLALKANYLSCTSMETPVGEDDDTVLGDLISTQSDESVEDIVMNSELRHELEKVFEILSPRESEIIKQRFGWYTGTPMTLEVVGKNFGVTRERIRQIEVKTLRKMRHPKYTKQLRVYMNA